MTFVHHVARSVLTPAQGESSGDLPHRRWPTVSARGRRRCSRTRPTIRIPAGPFRGAAIARQGQPPFGPESGARREAARGIQVRAWRHRSCGHDEHGRTVDAAAVSPARCGRGVRLAGEPAHSGATALCLLGASHARSGSRAGARDGAASRSQVGSGVPRLCWLSNRVSDLVREVEQRAMPAPSSVSPTRRARSPKIADGGTLIAATASMRNIPILAITVAIAACTSRQNRTEDRNMGADGTAPAAVDPNSAVGAFALQMIDAPKPPDGSFDAALAARGDELFKGAAKCSTCHSQDRAEAGWPMHSGRGHRHRRLPGPALTRWQVPHHAAARPVDARQGRLLSRRAIRDAARRGQPL